ncbi:DUF3566 domain-containing protein [Streptomyces sp. CRN 30]|uniref:DUF3566 domain-containing protein n=1 Tax=Streptomyces sp. CRN 30 TaxID=3075613 RepID=UPI002A812298|nr:DUF3566 domain-containing protein [Streptomyces sp. CRN 30]
MSGATGAGSAGTSRGTETDGGGRGSAAQGTDPHGNASSSSYETHGSQGGTVTETRGPQSQQYAAGAGPAASGAQAQATPHQQAAQQSASPLPGERQQQQAGGPYHPPQAYQTQAGVPSGSGARTGAVRRPRTGATTTPRVRKARLRVAKADPWSVMKVSFLLSIALGVCTIVASAVLWMVMDAMGVFSTVGGTISEATGSNESNGFDLQSFLSLPNVLLFTTIIAVIDVVLATALATLGAFIYNLSAGFVGGVELTLAEDE